MHNDRWKMRNGKTIKVSAMDTGWLCNALGETIRQMHERIRDYYEEQKTFKEVHNQEVISYLNRYPVKEESLRARWRSLVYELDYRTDMENTFAPGDSRTFDRRNCMYWRIQDLPPVVVLYQMYSALYEDKMAMYNSLRWRQYLYMLKYHRIGVSYLAPKSVTMPDLSWLKDSIEDFKSWEE